MIIAGAKGLASELLEIFFQRNALNNLYFFDNVSDDVPDKLFGQFSIVRSFEEVKSIMAETGDNAFCLGLGRPLLRRRVCDELHAIGGRLVSVISPSAEIGHYGTTVAPGCCILSGAIITTNVAVGRGCLINPNVTISHDSTLADFVEVSPGVNVTGNCHIGECSFLGAGSVILPKVRIGKNVVVAAGAVVTRDVPDNCMVAGVPAVVKKERPPVNL